MVARKGSPKRQKRRTPEAPVPVQRVEAPAPEPEQLGVGLECPSCGCRHFSTLEVRRATRKRIRRRRQCRHCSRRITTYEVVTNEHHTRYPWCFDRLGDAEFLPPQSERE